MRKKRAQQQQSNLDFVQVNLNDRIQYITDSMANDLWITINYKNSGWRTVKPKVWHNSQENKMSVFCYKENGDQRTYREDRITDLWVERQLQQATANQGDMDVKNGYEAQSYFSNALLPNIEQVIDASENETGTDNPFSDGIVALQNAIVDETDYVNNYQEEQNNSFDDSWDNFGDTSDTSDTFDDNTEDKTFDFDFDLDDNEDSENTEEDSSDESFDFDFDLDSETDTNEEDGENN